MHDHVHAWGPPALIASPVQPPRRPIDPPHRSAPEQIRRPTVSPLSPLALAPSTPTEIDQDDRPLLTTREHIHTHRHTATHARARFNWPRRQDPRFARTDPHHTTQRSTDRRRHRPNAAAPPGNRRAAIQRRNLISDAAREAREARGREREGEGGREEKEKKRGGPSKEGPAGTHRPAASMIRIDDPHRRSADPRIGESPHPNTSFAPRGPGRTDGTPRATRHADPPPRMAAMAHCRHSIATGLPPSSTRRRAIPCDGTAQRVADPLALHPNERRPMDLVMPSGATFQLGHPIMMAQYGRPTDGS